MCSSSGSGLVWFAVVTVSHLLYGVLEKLGDAFFVEAYGIGALFVGGRIGELKLELENVDIPLCCLEDVFDCERERRVELGGGGVGGELE